MTPNPQPPEGKEEVGIPGPASTPVSALHGAEGCASADLWRPIESAPKDGTWVLAVVGGAPERWSHLNGRPFVIRHEGQTPSGYDLGWSVHPGFGGVGDEWFVGWMPLPPPPEASTLDDGGGKS